TGEVGGPLNLLSDVGVFFSFSRAAGAANIPPTSEGVSRDRTQSAPGPWGPARNNTYAGGTAIQGTAFGDRTGDWLNFGFPSLVGLTFPMDGCGCAMADCAVRAQTMGHFLVRGTTPGDCWPGGQAHHKCVGVGPIPDIVVVCRCQQ